MRQPHRLVIAVAVLAGGAAVALLSRRHADMASPPSPSVAPKSPKSLGPLPLALPDEPPQPAKLSGQIEAAGTVRGPDPFASTSNSSIHSGAGASPEPPPPPRMDEPWRPSTRAAAYQGGPVFDRASRQAETLRPNSKPEKQNVVLHRVVDGDTLPALAHRYLGSSQRFTEIFDANRDRLPSPDLLPIGHMLRIPAAPTNTAE